MRRNKWVHDGLFITPDTVLEETTKFLNEFKEVHERPTNIRNAVSIIPEIRWAAPPEGWCKANWDVSIDKAQGRMGIRIAVRDDRGRVIAASSKMRQGSFEPATGEALPSFHAISLCKELGIQHIWLEGDAKIIVDALNSNRCTWSRYDYIVEDTRSILQTFPRWKCGFVHREAKEATHHLTKAANTNVSDRIWRDQTPDCISELS